MKHIEKEFSIANIIAKAVWTEEDLSSREKVLLEEWLNERKENQVYFEKCKSGLPADDYDEVVALFAKEKQWEALAHLVKPSRKIHWIRWAGYAASLLMLIAAGVWIEWNKADTGRDVVQLSGVIEESVQTMVVLKLDNGENYYIDTRDTLLNTRQGNIRVDGGQISYETNADTTGKSLATENTIYVPKGGVFSLVLSDGTQVFFNSDTELTYPVHFTGATREVKLKGEAAFDVKHNPTQPFIVHAKGLYAKVLGTSFNIFAYEDEPVVKATLLSGSIEVYTDQSDRRQKLKPGMQATLKDGEAIAEIREVDVEAQSQWKDGIIVLDKDELGSVMRMISRWYNVKVVYENEGAAKHTFTGLIDRNVDLKSVLETLTLIGGPEFKVEGTTVHVY